ncbi:hypothetical protein J3R83DRAFT_12216, partial [Lanmaoa asiatica]
WSTPVWLGLSILADISIAASICYVLQKGGPFTSMRLVCNTDFKITLLLIGIGTSLVTGITVALWIAAQLDPGHLFMSFPLGGSRCTTFHCNIHPPYQLAIFSLVYATCFMANLVARESYFHHIQIDEDGECFGMVTRSIVFGTPEGSEK